MIFDTKFINELKLIASNTSVLSREITQCLTRKITLHLEKNGWNATLEYPIELYRNGTRNTGETYRYQGHIDIYATKEVQKLAVEIDRSNKQWSYKKLEYCAKNLGSSAVWVRWKGCVDIDSSDTVTIYNIAPEVSQTLQEGQPTHGIFIMR